VTALALGDGGLCVERVPLTEIAARYGTPCFVYSRAALTAAYRAFDGAFASLRHLTCYAMKANSNLAVLDVFARLGSGFDVVSGGELARVIAAGGDPGKVVFSGVGKSDDELRQALALDILSFNVESASELEHLDRMACAAGKVAPVSIRVNPDVDPQTHPYIATGLKQSKFGIAFDQALPLYRHAAKLTGIALRGIDIHIGSQITALGPFREAATKLLQLVDALADEGIRLEHVDLGGGIGIRYRDETPVDLAEYAAIIRGLFEGRSETLLFEPGRWLTGNAGILLTRVCYLKPGAERSFAVVDAAMNDLLRPLCTTHGTRCGQSPRATNRPEHGRLSGPSARAPTFLPSIASSRSPRATCWRSCLRAHTRWP
jgi:diaminopimelate decarboxylase